MASIRSNCTPDLHLYSSLTINLQLFSLIASPMCISFGLGKWEDTTGQTEMHEGRGETKRNVPQVITI